jgi:sugar/nucleoside kinase (ribokinase family)
MSILAVGSVAYDTVKTPYGEVKRALGGSATYFSAAASLLSPVKIIGVVGEDFNMRQYDFLKKRGVDLTGLSIIKGGETFHWSGEYIGDMNEARTLTTCLNVFEHFNPVLSSEYKKSKYLFLGNIDPDLQLTVLEQAENPKIVALDTMNLWIEIKLKSLKKAIKKVDLLIMNDSEALSITGADNLVLAAKILNKFGPKAVILKKGAHGSYLRFGENQFSIPAFPLERVVDPTGAGDSFAGGVMGYLAKNNVLNFSNLKKAMIYGTVLASFNVEGFSILKLKKLRQDSLKKRYKSFLKIFRV